MEPQGSEGNRMTNTRVVAAANHVIHSLRTDLVRGNLRPGEPLRLANLADRYGSSVSGVREALLRLSEQHLVTLTPNAGFRVKEVSRADLEDLTDLRVLVEGEALRLSVINGDAEWEAGIVAAFHVLDRTPGRAPGQPGTTDEWVDAHARFHHSLIAACGRPRLLALADSLRDSAELYRQLSAQVTVEAGRDVPDEHRMLRDAAVDRDAKRSTALLAIHLRRTTDLLGPVVESTR
jgi:DNA-binding GntR family transcriptional regulator